MASAANESHATSRSGDDENWKYVECAKCREDAIIQDKQDPNNHIIRPDFHITHCGHVTCLKCLQASAGEGGSQSCPKCRLPLEGWMTLQEAQADPSLLKYFRSVGSMLDDIGRTLRTDNLREQATYYKSIAHKQSAALKGAKKELAELRAMNKNYEALQRENAALKNQLGGGIQLQTSPLMPSSTKVLPLEQREAQIQHRSHYEATTPASLTSDGVQQDFAAIRHHPGPAVIRDVRQDVPYVNPEALPQLQSRPIPRDSFPSVDNHGLKRTAEQAGLGQPSNFPPQMREAELPAFAMSSAHVSENGPERHDRADDGPSMNTSQFLSQFRAQGGASIGRPTSRQMSSPRAAGLSHRRSSSRGSRADLPSIEEAPFQHGSIRSDSAYPLEQGSSRHARGITLGDGDHTLRRNNSQNERNSRTYHTGKDHQYPDQTFMEASALQPAIRITQSGDDGKRSTFRQLVPRASTSAPTSDCEQHQGHLHHVSPPVQHQRPFHPVSARPSTAQAGSMMSSQRFGQQSMISRPATAQSVRHLGTPGGSRSILPMAIPSSAHRPSNSMIRSGARFNYQPDG